MRKLHSVSMVVLCLFGLSASSALAAASVEYVGANPYFGFPSTGGTGVLAGQQAGTATVEKTFTSLGDIPIIIHSTPSAGVDVLHIDERVGNNTGVDWTDFHFLFEPIDANPVLNVAFLNVTNPTGEWTSILPGPNHLTLLGSVPAGSIFSLSFDLVISSEVGSYDLFGIHQYPTVPEPATAALLSLPLVGLVLRRRRRSSAPLARS
ncbi:MAG: PEP-CTERM sorting domain-containing protein [Phycisphaerae bacterium]|nr:PEP-CTERM sorting domain-containing protein [Phycisphaerae bacterium]